MSPSNALMMFLSQTVMAAPLLLVYVAGMVLAARFWWRAPRPAKLAMGGLALLLLATVGGAALQAILYANTAPGGMGAVAMKMQVFSFAFMIVRAAGMGLVVAAVFAARGATSGFDVHPMAADPPLAELAPQGSPLT